MRNIRMIVPASRPELMPEFLEWNRAAWDRLHWTFVCNRAESNAIYPLVKQAHPEERNWNFWVSGFGSGNIVVCLHKMNYALHLLNAEGIRDYVLFLSDDNAVPSHVVDAWEQAVATDPDVVVVSHKRGQNVAGPLQHGTSDLVIRRPEDIRIGSISGEQYLAKADVFPGLFNENHEGDGDMVCRLRDSGCRFVFLPDIWMPFNLLERGRWSEESKKEIMNAASV